MLEYKNLGLIAVVILIIGLGFIVLRWPEGRHLSFSQHVAKYKLRIIYYNALFTIDLFLLSLFFFEWFMPNFMLSKWFGLFIVISLVFQYACTIIPETGGRKSYWHRLFAGISAIALIPVQILLLSATSVSVSQKAIILLGLLVMAFVAVLVARGRGSHSQFLLLQSLYFVAFFIPILWITYI